MRAEAPELKNMMPNSWKKLTRLPDAEERAFVSQGGGRKSMDDFKRKYDREDSPDFRVYRETVCGIDFYRLLICEGELSAFLAQTYGDTVLGDGYKSAEYVKFRKMMTAITAQIVFARGKDGAWKEIWNMPVRQGSPADPISRPVDYVLAFYDLMIRKLNGREIGFFTTEASIGIWTGYGEPVYIPNSEGIPWGDGGGPYGAYYSKTKGQLAGDCEMYFTKHSVGEEISAVRSKDEIRVWASPYLFDPKCPLKYSIQNAFDGDPATSYVENTEDDLMRITFSGFDERKYKKETAICIINGYAANEKLYYGNNRIKTMDAVGYMANETRTELVKKKPIRLEFADNNIGEQLATFDFDNRIGLFTFEVKAITRGKSFNDTCLAEFDISENNIWEFGKTK